MEISLEFLFRRSIMSKEMELIREKERDIPVYKKVDVVIAGSGPGGFGAAVAAARNGANTLLVERNGFLGGQATASMQVWFGGHDLLTGIGKELAINLDKLGAARYIERGRYPPMATGVTPMMYHLSFDPETWKYLAYDMIRGSGGKVLTHTMAVDVIAEDQNVKGIIIENKSGRQAILADVVIDATGDADLAFRAGAPIDKMPNGGYHLGMPMLFRVGGVNYQRIAEYARQHPEDFTPHTGVPPGEFDGINDASVSGMGGWISLVKEAKKNGLLPPDWRTGWGREGFSICGVTPYAIKNGVAYFDIVHIFKHVPYDAESICEAEFQGRERIREFFKFLKTVPGFESSFIIDTGASIGVQDSRRIIGEYVLTRKDIRAARTFEDDISLHAITWPDLPVEDENGGWVMHPADGSQGNNKWHSTMQSAPHYFQGVFGMPYRCLIPKGYDGLLVAGQTISMTFMAHEPGICRGMPPCMAWGEAAGTAAAISVKQGTSTRDVDIPTLRKTLINQNVILDKSLIDLSEITRLLISTRGIKIARVD
jgi:hypothetical protein